MRYGWIILLVSVILGLFVALLVILSPNTVLAEPAFRAGNVPRALRAWGVTWLFFNVIALVVLFTVFLEMSDPGSRSRDHLRAPGAPRTRSGNARFAEGQPFREPL